jgi:hypothetical protein
MKRLAILVLALGSLAGGVAYATIPDGSGVIHACYRTDSGAVRLIDAADQKCLDGEAAVDWSVRGPVGPTGAEGPAGPAGPAGAQGPAGQQGPAGPAGSGSLHWRGDYSPYVAYAVHDAVLFDGSSWIATASVAAKCSSSQLCPPGDEPGTNSDWSLLAKKGDTGAKGDTGERGPAGTQGPPGPQGATGAQGPPGISGYVVVEGPPATMSFAATSTAVCPVGKFVLGGGYYAPSVAPTPISLVGNPIVIYNRPINSGTAWEVRTRNAVPNPLQQRAYAICANVTF